MIARSYLVEKDFIEIGSKRIPLSDIKSYEITTEQFNKHGKKKGNAIGLSV